ncbi:hypothetical protein Hanom_Chr13g01195651 [Helianthus anomalus]
MSGLVPTRPVVSEHDPVVSIVVVLSQILRILELTTTHVGLARPRAGLSFVVFFCYFFSAGILTGYGPMLGGHDFCFCYFFVLDVDGGSAGCVNPSFLYSC